jgi:hypothetical protein
MSSAHKPHHDLKPCPFCGMDEIFLNDPSPDGYRYGSINCPSCLAVMPGETSSQDELIACWNTRQIEAPAEGEIEKLKNSCRELAAACQQRAAERDKASGDLLIEQAIDCERRDEIAKLLGVSGADRDWKTLLARLNECLTTLRGRSPAVTDEEVAQLRYEAGMYQCLYDNLRQRAEGGGVITAAQFLIDRLNDFEREIGEGDEYREYSGHVAPAVARLIEAIGCHSQPECVEKHGMSADELAAVNAYWQRRALQAEAQVKRIEEEARRYASFYPRNSNGQNTFVLFADWVASLAVSSTVLPSTEGRE